MSTFQQGDPVDTPVGPGRVAYVRMAPPTYSTPEAVSVVLDARRGDPRYTGSIFSASDVTPRHVQSMTCRHCGLEIERNSADVWIDRLYSATCPRQDASDPIDVHAPAVQS